LIEEGKLYERETRPERGRAAPRPKRGQVLSDFVQALFRIARPAYRAELVTLLQGLERAPRLRAVGEPMSENGAA